MEDASLRLSAVVMAVVGAACIAASVALGALIFFSADQPFAIDAAWNSWLVDWRSPFMTGLALTLDWIGGGLVGILVVPIGGAIALIAIRRPWSATYFVAAQIGSAACVQVIKDLLGRARPEEMLIISDHGSYPSGHTANAATLAVAAFVLLPRLWVVVAGAGYVVLMGFSRTYLHAHWLSDTVGGALLGAGVGLLVAAAFADVLARERARERLLTPSLG